MVQKRILILRFSALGDVLILLPLLKSIQNSSSPYHFTVASMPKLAFLFKDIPNVDFIGVDFKEDYKGVKGLLDLFHVFYGMKFDAVLDLHDVIRTKVLKVLFKMVGTPVFTFEKGRAKKKKMIENKSKNRMALPTTFDRYFNALKTLDNEFEIIENQLFEKIELSEKCAAFLGDFDRKFIGIAPFSKHKSKEYSLDKIKEMVAILSTNKSIQFLIFGCGENEKNQIESFFKDSEKVKNAISKFTFEEECALISNLDIMVSMDSANGHISALFGVPTLTIWGATHPIIGFQPYNQPQENQIIPNLDIYPNLPLSVYGKVANKEYENIINSIQLEQIVIRIEEILKLR
jgi:ADP-heptose:LPS heptosyltransferase